MANLYGFNPRTRKGCDVNKTKLMIDIRVSIHAPVKDATFSCHLLHRHIQGFNPRTRKGCDLSVDVSTDKGKVSIHAPVKDATN